MKKTIKDIIKETLLKERIINEENINKILDYLGQEQIKNSELISRYYKRKMDEKELVYIKDFINLNIEEAKRLLGSGETTTYIFLRTLTKKISLKIIKLTIIDNNKNKAKLIHIKIEELLDKLDNKLIEKLKEEIAYKEMYNSLEPSKKEKLKKFKNSRLHLNQKEIKILKNYLQKSATINYINDVEDNNIYIGIINIYRELCYFFIKLEYKDIVDKNYKKIEELEIFNKATNALKRNNIFYVKDLIEFSEEELQEIPSLGISSIEIILEKLKEKNILLLKEKEAIIKNLKKENANIVKSKQK